MALRMDPELAAAMAAFGDAPAPVFADAQSLRAGNNAAAEITFQKIAFPEGIEESTHSATSIDGSPITIRRFLPQSVKDSAGPHRAVIYAFGGGFVSGAVSQFRSVIGRAAVGSSTQYFGAEYRIAPENPFPAGVEDFYSTITWLQAHADEFNVDPARIIVHGQSAGAGVVAGAALMARDKGLNPPIAGQVLKYPMIDDRTSLDEDSSLWKFLFWSVASNDIGWKAYLGGKDKSGRIGEDISEYAAPARARDVGGLPRTFIEVGGLDLFRDEAINYAARLVDANVDTEFHLYPGLAHGYDGLAPNIKAAQDAEVNIAKFVSSF